MAGYRVRVTIDDPKMAARIAERHRNLAPLLKQVGAIGLRRMQRNVVERQKKDAPHTGLLIKSLAVGGQANGNVFELSKNGIEVGSNLHYAGYRNVGGTIVPSTAKALAIPLTKKLILDRQWPRHLDPSRSVLKLIPLRGRKASAILVDENNQLGYGKGPLFALVKSVTQVGMRFAEWAEADLRKIVEVIYPRFWRGKNLND